MKKNRAAQSLGRRGGLANTPAQQRARKDNARRFAGRPRRVCQHCNEPVIGGHVDRGLDQSCGAHGWRWEKRRDRVQPATPATIDAQRDAINAEIVRLQTVLAAFRQSGLK